MTTDNDSNAQNAERETALKEEATLKENAEQGNIEAQYSLGMMYFKGKVIPNDYEKAAKYFDLAAKEMHADAQFVLGWLYFEGKGVPQNYTEAVRLYALSANQGNFKAQNNLGNMYSSGKGIPQNYRKAYVWYSLSAMNGKEIAVKNREVTRKKLTPADLSRAQDEALLLAEDIKKRQAELADNKLS